MPLALDVRDGLLDDRLVAEPLLAVVSMPKAVVQSTVAQDCCSVGLAAEVHLSGPAHSNVLVAVDPLGMLPIATVHLYYISSPVN